MSIILFAIIGAKLQMGAGYWICYGIGCFLKLSATLYKVLKED